MRDHPIWDRTRDARASTLHLVSCCGNRTRMIGGGHRQQSPYQAGEPDARECQGHRDDPDLRTKSSGRISRDVPRVPASAAVVEWADGNAQCRLPAWW